MIRGTLEISRLSYPFKGKHQPNGAFLVPIYGETRCDNKQQSPFPLAGRTNIFAVSRQENFLLTIRFRSAHYNKTQSISSSDASIQIVTIGGVRMATLSEHPEATLVCSVPCTATYGTGDNLICVRKGDGAPISLNGIEARLLSRMQTARTLNEWLEILSREIVQERLESLRVNNKHLLGRLLGWASWFTESVDGREVATQNCELPLYKSLSVQVKALVERGLVAPVTLSDHSTESAANVSVEDCRVTTLCIPTCGRGAYLSRCLQSFTRNLRAHGRDDASILVVDDSSDQSSEGNSRDLVEKINTPDGIPVQLIGHEERRNLIRTLLQRKIAPPAVIEFALDPDKLLTTEGAVRNIMMLLTGGQYVLHADDDTVCAYIAADAASKGVTVSDDFDPYETHFFTDRNSNLKEFPVTSDIDAFSIHEAVLGKPLRTILRTAGQITWKGINPHDYLNPPSQACCVNLTTTGASGDPGMESSLGFLTASPLNTLKRAYSCEESYRLATESREILRLAPELTISRRPAFMAMSFGMNNKRLQPPFFPLGRNLDGAFAHIYHLADNSSLIGHLPFAIAHLSEPNRKYWHVPSDQVCRMGLADILQLCLTSVSRCVGVSLSQNLRSIGEQLIGLGSLSEVTFRSFLRERFISTRMTFLQDLTNRIDKKAFASEKWSDEINSLSSKVRLAMLNDESMIPVDLAKTTLGGALLAAQSLVKNYGALLLHWESIYDTALECKK